MSLFVLVTFVSSLGAPVVVAAQGTTAAAVADAATAASTKGLGDLWFFWTDHIKNLKVQPGREAAYEFFAARGATEAQATALTYNAETAGHLSSATPSAASATSNVFSSFFNKVKGIFGGGTAAASTANTSLSNAEAIAARPIEGGVQATVTKTPVDVVKSGVSTLSDKVRAFFGRFKSGSSAASSGAVAATDVSPVGVSSQAVGTSDLGILGKAGLTAKRVAATTGGAVKTGWLTLGDKLDFNRYYKIPVTDTTAIKVRGEWSSTTKFTDKGWVVEKYNVSSKTPGSLGDTLGQVEAIAAKPAPTGFFGKLFSKFKDAVTTTKNKMTGKGYTTEETKMELNKLKIEGDLMEQARMLNDAQRAIKYRIDQLTGSANALRKPIPQEEITALQKQYDAIENTKQQLAKKVAGVQEAPAKTIVKDAARWALYSIGITASVNLIKQAFSGEGIDIKKAFSFLGEPQFWGGTVGGFLGSTLLTTLAANILPPGAGLFLKILPGFLGASLGFEFGAGLFGGEMDLLGSIVQTIASAGGYTLAMTMIGPGIPALLAAIAAGSLASILLNKLRGGFQSEAYTLPPNPEDVPAASDSVVQPVAATVAVDPKMSNTTGMSLAEAQAEMKDAYNRYINNLKERKLVEAREAREEYEAARQKLDSVKSGAVNE